MQEEQNSEQGNLTPKTEPAPTPLISAAEIPHSRLPVRDIPRERMQALEVHAQRRIETGSRGHSSNHLTGLLGEDAVASHFGVPERLDTELYTDGDGGVDFRYHGATIDVKTVGRHRETPALTVDAYEPLRADYYVLAHRIGPNRCRLIGYAPRQFVANAPTRHSDNGYYHFVEQQYLFPIRN